MKEVILDFFDRSDPGPVTASEIASETGYSIERVQANLQALGDRGFLTAKPTDGDEPAWWPAARVPGGGLLGGRPAPEETVHRQASTKARRRLLEQHRQLAELASHINVTDDLDEILRLITEAARELVGAHQSVTSRTINQNWEQAINAVSLSEKYADYREYDTQPDGSGIYSLVCQNNEPMRMSQAELEAHPAWNAFGDEKDEHPPMRGWLAVPIIGPAGRNMGLIQLSDKYQGEFTEADEAILTQLANVASAAIENARLYDELRESEERYRTLFESMTEGYSVIEKVDTGPTEPDDFRYVEANPAFERHTGLDDVVGKTVRAVMPDDPQEWLDRYERVVQSGSSVTFEREQGPDGRVLQCQAFPIGDAPDGHVGVTVLDVTERVERERRLKESNERLEQFAYAASHDLQEPLRMVSSYLRLLEKRCADDLDESGMEFLEFAVDGADRMREMIDGLLTYSRVESKGNPLEPIDLDAVVDDVIEDLQLCLEETGTELTVDSLPRVMGDGGQLRQLFQNLLTNAVEYSGDDPPVIHVSADRDGPMWLIAVRDEGIGIDADHQARIFEVFQRLHTHDEHQGTGIGLAVCERIVERHGGDLWVESEPGKGSTFYVTLPTVAEREE